MDFNDIDSDNGSQQAESESVNPAWNDVLNVIPEDVRESVIPKFREWDSNFQTQVQKVHSDYEPYKFLKEDGIAGDDVRMALGIMNAIQDNPEQVYKSLGENFGFNSVDAGATNGSISGQGVSGQGNTEAGDFNLPPEVQKQLERLQTGHDTMAQIILAEQRKQEDAQRDAALKDEMDQLEQKHGKFDKGFVLSHMAQGASSQQAIEAYQNLVEQIRSDDNRPKAPRLLSSGGAGIPGQGKVDVTKLSDAATKDLVSNYLRDARASNQG